ncbi:hypothetical protein [Roseivirga sp.]|uniref:hypothetical protein n=1 Tax=Roseivirga sp. TaxID=1964215 RepID=UPI003B52D213
MNNRLYRGFLIVFAMLIPLSMIYYSGFQQNPESSFNQLLRKYLLAGVYLYAFIGLIMMIATA